MGKGKKPFIDRKNAVTFHLVHRSQHDPLVTDETAPQRVLLEAPQRNQTKDAAPNTAPDTEKRRKEQQLYGIFYDDDYDYLQHMRKRENDVVWEYAENPNQARKAAKDGKQATQPKINLPSSVFATEYEEDVGMLNKAAPHPGPRPDWDPDIAATFDDEYVHSDNESELSDDFIMKAMGGDVGDEDDENDEEERDFDSDDLNDEDDDDDDDDVDEAELMDRLAPLLRERRFDDEETKSRFTEYSMSSSVLRRNEQLTLLDDRFERFYATYDDPELGDLAMEEIEGAWPDKHPYVLNCCKDMKKDVTVEPYNKEWDAQRVKKYRNVVDGDVDPDEELIEHDVEDPKEKKWDCESILSTYSNIYNHPKTIDEPKRRRRSNSSGVDSMGAQNKIEIDPKTGLPTNVLRGGESGQLTAKALSRLEDGTIDAGAGGGPKSLCAKSVMSTLSVLSIRPKDETPEEKQERKRLLKEYRKERRIERKANAEAFKEEKKRQTHVKINQRTNQMGKQIV